MSDSPDHVDEDVVVVGNTVFKLKVPGNRMCRETSVAAKLCARYVIDNFTPSLSDKGGGEIIVSGQYEDRYSVAIEPSFKWQPVCFSEMEHDRGTVSPRYVDGDRIHFYVSLNPLEEHIFKLRFAGSLNTIQQRENIDRLLNGEDGNGWDVEYEGKKELGGDI